MHTTDPEKVDFFIDEDFAVVYYGSNSSVKGEIEKGDKVSEIVLEILESDPSISNPSKPLHERVKKIHEEELVVACSERDSKTVNSTLIFLQPPEALNTMDMETSILGKKIPVTTIGEADVKLGEQKRSCCRFLTNFFSKKKG